MANILVVDDDHDILDLVRSVLADKHTVLIADSGPEALQLLASNHVDLLVTDVRMPGMNGFALITEAKKSRPDLNVIVMSAYIDDTDEIATQVLRRYTDIALCKPIHVRQFSDLVSAALAA